MFLNYIKNYFLIKFLKNKLQNVKASTSKGPIQTVGVLVDESYFLEKKGLIKELVANGILESNIKVIVYRDKLQADEVYSQPTFGTKHFNLKTLIASPTINAFINKEFDLLISYYDIEKAILLRVTHNSKAHFKVGFSNIDQRLNHLMISTNVENYTVFVHELFRYLKILNKI